MHDSPKAMNFYGRPAALPDAVPKTAARAKDRREPFLSGVSEAARSRAHKLDDGDDPQRLLFTIPEAARTLRISRSGIYPLLDVELPTVRIGKRRLIRRTDIETYVKRLAGEVAA